MREVLQLSAMNKECVLYDRYCIECGECNLCDLDDNKICDNCGKCIEEDADYIGIDIDDIITEEEWYESEEDIEVLVSNWKYDKPYSVDLEKE